MSDNVPSMAARRVTFAPSGLSPSEAKRMERRAWSRARGSGAVPSAIVDKFWSDTLMVIEHQPAATATEMLRRTEHLIVLIEDRAHWGAWHRDPPLVWRRCRHHRDPASAFRPAGV